VLSMPSGIQPVVSAPHDPALLEVSSRVLWWLTPEQGLEDTLRFVAQVMVFGTWDDVQTTLRIVGEANFRQVLSSPPAGVFDPRSWNYWHLRFGISPVPKLPTRKL
jgi:hypothetical protein